MNQILHPDLVRPDADVVIALEFLDARAVRRRPRPLDDGADVALGNDRRDFARDDLAAAHHRLRRLRRLLRRGGAGERPSPGAGALPTAPDAVEDHQRLESVRRTDLEDHRNADVVLAAAGRVPEAGARGTGQGARLSPVFGAGAKGTGKGSRTLAFVSKCTTS